MPLFGGTKPSSFLGVDIGAGGIKVVELGSDKGRPTLLTYGYSERKPGESVVSPFDDVKGAGETLSQVCKRAGTKATKAMAALPLSAIFSTIVAVPRRKDEKELKPLIDAQVAKLTPLPLAEMITYSTFIDPLQAGKAPGKEQPPATKPSDYVRVLVTGAAKTLVQKYVDIFRAAKLELQAIDTESFALIRSLVGKDKGAIMLLDVGFARTNITVVEKGIPFLTRSINVGGVNVTRKIMETTGVSEAEAEQVKTDLGNQFTPTGASGPAAAGTLPPAVSAVVAPVLHEVQYAMQLYARMELTEFKAVEKIVLTGGSAHLPGVPEHLAAALNVNVYRGDPWARVAYPADLRPVLDEIGPRMAVAIGLAMRDIE